MRDQLVEQQQEEDEGFKEDYQELRERKTRNLRLDDEYFYTEEDNRDDQQPQVTLEEPLQTDDIFKGGLFKNLQTPDSNT